MTAESINWVGLLFEYAKQTPKLVAQLNFEG
jgi:hypothetical protein